MNALLDGVFSTSHKVQSSFFGDSVFFKDSEGEFSIEAAGIFKTSDIIVDSITQQSFFSSTPTLWLDEPYPVKIEQDVELKVRDKYYKIKEIRPDVDDTCLNCLLYEFTPSSLAEQ